jgi:trimethylamine--corrinoid protein Co-methyltransferase
VDLLAQAGADVSDVTLVRFPPHLVERAIRTAPRQILLYDRSGAPAMRLVGRQVYFGTGSDCHFLLDPKTGERRKFRKRDVADAIRLCDALPNIDFVLSIGLASDVPTRTNDVHQFDAMVRQTSKPIVFTSHDLVNCKTIVEMAERVAGGEQALRQAPHVIHFAEVDCPLKLSAETCEKLIFLARRRIPVIQGAGPMMGASGPQTHAGVLALANAECLAGNVLLQVASEGAPFIRGIGAHPFDMKQTVLPYGAPELSLNNAAAADLARYYQIPTWGYAGCSDAKEVDEQAALEAMLSITLSIASGANLVHDVGYLESGLTSSYEMIVLSDTAIAMARAALKTVEVNDETLALGIVHAVGHHGNYLAEDHTFRHYREVWYSDMIDRRGRDKWEAAGRPSIGGRLRDRVNEILRSHPAPRLDDGAASDLERLVAEADSRAEQTS